MIGALHRDYRDRIRKSQLSSLISLSLIAFNSTKAGPGGWEDTSDLKLIAKKERYTKEEP